MTYNQMQFLLFPQNTHTPHTQHSQHTLPLSKRIHIQSQLFPPTSAYIAYLLYDIMRLQ